MLFVQSALHTLLAGSAERSEWIKDHTIVVLVKGDSCIAHACKYAEQIWKAVPWQPQNYEVGVRVIILV